MAKKKSSKLLNSYWLFVPFVLLGAPLFSIIFFNALMSGILILLGDLVMKCENLQQKNGMIILFGLLSGVLAFVAPFLALISVTVSFWSLPWLSAASIAVAVGGIGAAKAAGIKGFLVWLAVVGGIASIYYLKKAWVLARERVSRKILSA